MNERIDLTLLFLVFLTLKLCGVINWSWWWVTCPLWGFFAFIIIILFFAALFRTNKN